MNVFEQNEQDRARRQAARSDFRTAAVDITVPRFQAVVRFVEDGVTKLWQCAHEHKTEGSARECTRWAENNLAMGYEVYGTITVGGQK